MTTYPYVLKPNGRSHRSDIIGPMPSDRIVVRGAREHNLKNIDVEMPRDRLIVITGLSGCGKSSLAFDTIYAEGQRRYVESLCAYARQFLGQMEKPDVDQIDGLSPGDQHRPEGRARNPRSTVGTVTEIYDYLRLLFARIGRMHCPICGREIARQTVEQIVDQLYDLPEGTRIMLLAPLVRDRKGEHEKLLAGAKQAGFVRVRVDGELRDLDEEITLDKKFKHRIEVVVDRLVVRRTDDDGNPRPDATRMADSIETALRLSDGTLLVHLPDARQEGAPSGSSASGTPAPSTAARFEEPAPRNFTSTRRTARARPAPGSAAGWRSTPTWCCPTSPSRWPRARSCRGGGWWSPTRGSPRSWTRSPSATASGHDRPVQRAERGGAQDPAVRQRRRAGRGQVPGAQREQPHLPHHLRGRRAEPGAALPRDGLGGGQGRDRALHDDRPCPTCGGMRLKPESLSVTVGGRNIIETTRLSVTDALAWYAGLPELLTERENQIARQVLKEIRARLGFLVDVGLDYLTLDRASGTLSGGEAQRIRLATQIGSSLMGVLYILDEPSIGLHQRDNARLIATLVRLRDLGNTLIVVEHDEETIRSADWVIDIGPGAGEHGGELIHSGPLDELLRNQRSDHRRLPARRPVGAGAAASSRGQRGVADRARRGGEQPAQASTSPSRSAASWRSPG